jgi:hypothetical protein
MASLPPDGAWWPTALAGIPRLLDSQSVQRQPRGVERSVEVAEPGVGIALRRGPQQAGYVVRHVERDRRL